MSRSCSFRTACRRSPATLDGGRSDLDGALTNLSQAVGEVTRFVHGTRDKTSEQVQRLANVTQNLVDHRMDLEQVLHVAPTAFANAYNMFDPRTGGAGGVFVLNNMSNPTMFICGMMGAIENVTAPETGKLCAQYLGPGLQRLNFNYLPFPFNPGTHQRAVTGQDHLQRARPGPRWCGQRNRGAGTVGVGLDRRPRRRISPGVRAGDVAARRRTTVIMPLTRTLAAGCTVLICATGCAFQGVNSLPLPGTVGNGKARRRITSSSPMSVRWSRTRP